MNALNFAADVLYERRTYYLLVLIQYYSQVPIGTVRLNLTIINIITYTVDNLLYFQQIRW